MPGATYPGSSYTSANVPSEQGLYTDISSAAVDAEFGRPLNGRGLLQVEVEILVFNDVRT